MNKVRLKPELVVVACSFVYGNAKVKAITQENSSKEDSNNNMKTVTSEPLAPPPPPESAGETEAVHTPLDYSGSVRSRSGGGNRLIDLKNHTHLTDINLASG